MKKSNSVLIIASIIIFLIGFSVRIYNINRNPAGFFADEASIGYNAFKLLTTGTDEYGKPWPFFFESFGDYRNPVPIYINIPLIFVFGLNEFSVRATAAISGAFTVLLLMIIAWEANLFNDQKLKFVFTITSGLFISFLPWHIHFSRFGSEYIYFPLFLTLGWWLFLKGITNPTKLIFSALAFGVCLYTYYPAWLVTPLFVFALFVIYLKQLRKFGKYTLLSFLIFVMALIPLLIGIKYGYALTRWKNVTITKNAERLIPLKFINNYIVHFSPDFLFIKGDIDFPGHFIKRFGSRGAGELYIWMAPLLVFGLIYIISKRNPFLWSLLILTLLYPLGSTLADTDGGAPLAFRSIIGVIPFPLLSALGFTWLFQLSKNKLVRTSIVSILLIALIYSVPRYLIEYHAQYPLYSSDFWGWQYGARDVMSYFISNRNQYDDLFLSDEFNAPEIFIKFYDPLNLCQSKCQVGEINRLNINHRQIFAMSPTEITLLPDSMKHEILQNFYYPNNEAAFSIVRFLPY